MIVTQKHVDLIKKSLNACKLFTTGGELRDSFADEQKMKLEELGVYLGRPVIERVVFTYNRG